MNKNEQLLAGVRIASPCHARWEDMQGDDRTRFCSQCSKRVYNFSGMPQAEVVQLLHETEGRVCGRFFRRADGTMLTADCPIGAERPIHWLKQWFSAAAACFWFLGLPSFAAESKRPATGNPGAFSAGTKPNNQAMLGEVALRYSTNGSVINGSCSNGPALLGKIALPPRTAPNTNSVSPQRSSPK